MFLVPAAGHVHADHFEVLAEGKTADLQPDAPVAVGDDVDVKLVEVDLHDATAGVGKLDGYDVIVAGAAKLVGKKAKAVVGASSTDRCSRAWADGRPRRARRSPSRAKPRSRPGRPAARRRGGGGGRGAASPTQAEP